MLHLKWCGTSFINFIIRKGGREEGKTEGREAGMKEGREEGRKGGWGEGRLFYFIFFSYYLQNQAMTTFV